MTGEEQSIAWSDLPELDAREVFFIRHATRIRDWAALERDVGAHAEHLLVGIAQGLAQAGGLQGLHEQSVTIACNLDQGYPKVELRRPTWPDGELSVALGWQAGKVGFEGPGAPYVGVLTTGSWRSERPRRQGILDRLSIHRSDLGASTSSWWPTFRRLPIPYRLVHDDCIDLDGYRDHLLAEIRREWHAVADILDEVVAEHER
jgi:hypothetical protein